ncbi:MAG: His/Gly/Thr/Pro-type tRNA ligase C-terminal domain-containing protein, partial [Gemmataceae bacterium]
PKTSTPAPVLILQFDSSFLGTYQQMARELRAAGIGVEVYPEAKKLGPQFKYAESRGFRLALIAGSEEIQRGQWKLKNLATKEETTVPADQLREAILAALR